MAAGLVTVTVLATGCSASSGSATSGSSGTASIADWRAPVHIEPTSLPADYDSIYGVSCPTSTFCMAVDTSGSALVWRGRSWSSPRRVWDHGTLDSVSCATATDCVAVGNGEATTWDGTTWSASVSVGPPGTYRLSCPTASFCATVAASGTAGGASTVGTYDGRSWSTRSTPTTGATDDRLMDVSCATPTFCMAVNLDGASLAFDGTGWSPVPSSAPRGTISVSCPAASTCRAVSTAGSWTRFSNGSWSAPKAVPALQGAFAYSLSCSTATQCVAVGLLGKATTWSNGSWSEPTQVFHDGVSATVDLSCAPAGPCVAVNSKGDAAVTS